MTIDALEIAVDDALKKADFNYDGMISWQEYVYSLAQTPTVDSSSSEEIPALNEPAKNNEIEDNKIEMK